MKKLDKKLVLDRQTLCRISDDHLRLVTGALAMQCYPSTGLYRCESYTFIVPR